MGVLLLDILEGRIKKLRQRRNLTQRQLAEALNTTRATLASGKLIKGLQIMKCWKELLLTSTLLLTIF